MAKKPKYSSCFLGIDYDEGEPTSYRAVVVTDINGEDTRFETGDPVADWHAASDHARELVQTGQAAGCMTLSSCSHFVFDVPGYRFNVDDDLELDPNDWTDGVLTPKSYDDDGSPD